MVPPASEQALSAWRPAHNRGYGRFGFVSHGTRVRVTLSAVSEMYTSSFGADEDATAAFGAHISPVDALRGEQVGSYRLLEVIGEGGFGTVFLAEQTEPVQRRVAIKLLRPGMDCQSVIARFEVERQVLAMMDHPGIATVLDAGQTSLGRPYFVMEYVRGRPISEYCDASSLDLRKRVELIRKVCMAVQHAHQKGVIHRDLKPSNVLVSISDGAATPKVIDFGIAKAISRANTESAAYTGIHQLLGTPAYMSPEQAGGASHEVDIRSDVFSLGAMMYELFTGTTPIKSAELHGLSIPEMHNRIVTETVTAMSDRLKENADTVSSIATARSSDAASLRSELRGDLNWIVLKCLEKDPSRRYETVAALDADLGRYLNHEAVLAGPPSNVYRFKKFVRRRRIEVAASAAIALALVLGFIGTSVGWAHANEESTRLRATLDFFNSTLAGVSSDTSAVPIWSDNPSLTLGEALSRSQSMIDKTFEPEPELEANIRQLVGLAQLRGGEFTDAVLQLSRAYELRERELGSSHPQSLELLLPIVEARTKAGDIDGALESAASVYARYSAAFGAEAEQTRAVALWNARWLASGFRFAEAERYFDLAVTDIAGSADMSDPITLAASIEQVSTLVAEGQLSRAEAILRAAKPQIERLDSGASEITTLFSRQFGQVLTLRGFAEEAIEFLRVRPGDSAQQADRVRGRLLAWSLGHAGRRAESDEMFSRLLTVEREQPGPPFREVFLRLYRADALIREGRYAEALIEASTAIDRYDAQRFPNDPDRLWGRLLEARALVELGDRDSARSALIDADALDEQFPEYRLRIPELLFTRAKLSHLDGRGAEARQLADEAVKSSREVFGPAHWLTMEMTGWRASLNGDGD